MGISGAIRVALRLGMTERSVGWVFLNRRARNDNGQEFQVVLI